MTRPPRIRQERPFAPPLHVYQKSQICSSRQTKTPLTEPVGGAGGFFASVFIPIIKFMSVSLVSADLGRRGLEGGPLAALHPSPRRQGNGGTQEADGDQQKGQDGLRVTIR